MLPTRTCTVKHMSTGQPVAVQCVRPSHHVRHDLLFAETFKLFKEADTRFYLDRELHPEFVHSPLFLSRAAVLRSGRLVPRFVLHGMKLAMADVVDVKLADGAKHSGLEIMRAYFASALATMCRDDAGHAGDFVADCRPTHPSSSVAGLIVSWLWCVSSFPSLSWHPGVVYSVVEIIHIEKSRADGVGGAESNVTADEASEAGHGAAPARRLLWGEDDRGPFIVICFCFYSDGFGTRSGKAVSLSGVYMSYLSWLYRHRCTSSATRIIATTPPGVDSDCVLEAITDDLREGVCMGWLCRCADGSVVSALEDVCFYLGDYLQVSKTTN